MLVPLRFRKFLRDRSGATAVEYGLLAALISVALIAGLSPLSGTIKETFLTLSNTLLNAN
jgi:pilus assembly protein Flp/PilA